MDKLSGIGSISKNILKLKAPKAKEQHQNNASNPFGLSFKGKMITADVFKKAETEDSIRLTRRIANRSKLISSTIVGSISDFASGISSRLNSVANFGRRIKNNITEAWNKAKNTEISFGMLDVKNLIKTHITDSKENLSRRPVNELEMMLTDCISDLQAGEAR